MYRLRFIKVMLSCFFSKPKKIYDVFELHFIAIPFLDTDVTRLFTQTYMSLMGLARWHFVFASNLGKIALKNKWAPVTTSDTVTYKRSITAFSKITLKTKLIAWDEQRFYLEHTFFSKGKLTAQCYVEGLIRAPHGIMRPGDVFDAAGMNETALPFPEDLKKWTEFLREKNQNLKQTSLTKGKL